MPNRPVQLLLLALLALLALFGCDPQHDQYRQAMLRILHGDPATGARMLTALADNGYVSRTWLRAGPVPNCPSLR